MQATIIMSIYNGATILGEVFNFLEKQNHKERVKEIVLIDDNSKDESPEILKEYQKKSSFQTRVIFHQKTRGLAGSFNHGIKLSKTDYFILMQDVILRDLNSLKKITDPFLTDQTIVATYPVIVHPYWVWKTYNFWQQCLWSRLIDKENTNFDIKFACIKKTGLLFDERTYWNAEEYFDYQKRLEKYGKIVPIDLKVIHFHSQDKNFLLMEWFKKEARWAEGYGVNLRKYFFEILKEDTARFFLMIFRPLLLFSLFINWGSLNRVGLIIFIVFTFFYAKLVYLKSYRNPRILILPFVIFLTLVIYSFYFAKGFIYEKETV